MRILMLSSEYPPAVIGGLGRAVADLSEALSAQGHDVRVLTGGAGDLPEEELMSGVTVYRVYQDYPQPLNFLDSVLYLNLSLIQRAQQLLRSGWHWDILHGHDWLVTHASKVLKHTSGHPMVATIHATEWGRNQGGLHNDLQHHIHSLEWLLTYEAYQVICCSHYMMGEIQNIFQTPADKLWMIPNGVKLENFEEVHSDLNRFREKYAYPLEKIVYYVGRLVHEKGVQVILEAATMILDRYPNTRFVIAGKGPAMDSLRAYAHHLGVASNVYFVGFVDDVSRNSLYRVADISVFPSLYEPFGIVALEAMAAQSPVIVSDVGGLREIIRHGENGLTSYVGHGRSLADSIIRLLENPGFAKRLSNNAFQEVKERYNWELIATETLKVYEKAQKVGEISDVVDHSSLLSRYNDTIEPKEIGVVYR